MPATITNAPVVLRDPREPQPVVQALTRTNPATGPLLTASVPAVWTAENPPRYTLNQRALVAPGGSPLNGRQPVPGAVAGTLTVAANGTSGAVAAVAAAASGGSGIGMTITTTVAAGVVDTAVIVAPGTGYRVGDVVRIPQGAATGPIAFVLA